ESIVVETLNPKTALFFLSFLPQFTDVNAAWPVWLQMLVLGAVVNIMFSATDILCVLLADRVTRFVSIRNDAGKQTMTWARRAGGAILVGLGVRLALSR
ncbi:MAG: LysE family transporter, partial [Pseudomonadota bacterium]